MGVPGPAAVVPAPPPPEPPGVNGDGFGTDWTVAQLVAWASGNPARVERVLEAEAQRGTPRRSLWNRLGRRYGG